MSGLGNKEIMAKIFDIIWSLKVKTAIKYVRFRI